MFYQLVFDPYDIDSVAGFSSDRGIEVEVDNQMMPWGNTGQEVITQNRWTLDFSMLSDDNKAKIANAILADLGIDQKVEFETKKVAKLS